MLVREVVGLAVVAALLGAIAVRTPSFNWTNAKVGKA
jgi:hypothetical protein